MSVKIGVINTPPGVSSCALSPDCRARGFSVDMANVVCKLLRLNCTLVMYPSDSYGDVDENTNIANGLLGEIQRGKLDLSLPIMMPTYRRSKAVAFSRNYFCADLALITRAPKTSSNIFNWSVVFAFQWPICVAIFATLFVISILITLRNLKIFIPDMSICRTVSAFVETCSSLVTMNYESLTNCWSIRLVIGSWSLSTIVLAGAYGGMLFSQKLTKIEKPPFVDMKTFGQCLEDKRCRLIMPSNVTVNYLQLAASERIGQALQSNPVLIVPHEQIVETIFDEQNIYLVWFWPKGQVIQDNKRDGCDFYLVDTPYAQTASFAMRKSFPLSNAFDELALTFRENGIAEFMSRKYLKYLRCNDRSDSWLDEGRGLHAFRTIFYFYIVGLSCAVIALTVEIALAFLRSKVLFTCATAAIRAVQKR